MSRWIEIRTAAGVLRRFDPTEVVIDGLEAVAEYAAGPPEFTLDGREITQERARQILEAEKARR